MTLPLIAMAAGIVCLVWSADKFVEGAAALAVRMGVSMLIVGMVIVGFGTSMPEMIVSALSAWQGAPGLALGNAFGSNIANITLILGVAALVNPMTVKAGIVRREIPVLIVITIIAIVIIWWGGVVSRLEAIVLLLVFAATMIYSSRGVREEEVEAAADGVPGEGLTFRMAVIWTIIGLVALMASSQALVWGATEIAHALGVSDLTIGLTIVAVGTSLPELASSVAAARKNHHDIAVGNVIGSNIFNTLAVVGIAGVIHPMTVDSALYRRDMPTMAAVTILLWFLCRGRRNGAGIITRGEGVFLLLLFALYTLWVVVSSAPAA